MFRFTKECASSEHSYGSMAFKYFLFRSIRLVSVLVFLNLFFAFLPKISAMVTSAVNITKPLKRIYPQIHFFVVVVVVVSTSFSNCSRKFSWTFPIHSGKKSIKTFCPCFQLFLFSLFPSSASSCHHRKCYLHDTFCLLRDSMAKKVKQMF